MVRVLVWSLLSMFCAYATSMKAIEIMAYIEKYGVERVGLYSASAFKLYEKRWGESNLKSFSIKGLKILSKKYTDRDIRNFGAKNIQHYKLKNLKQYGLKLLGDYELEVLKKFPLALLKKATQVKCSFSRKKCTANKNIIRWFELEKNYKARKVCEIGAKIILKMKFCKLLNLK